jgi:hypothetical protein
MALALVRQWVSEDAKTLANQTQMKALTAKREDRAATSLVMALMAKIWSTLPI